MNSQGTIIAKETPPRARHILKRAREGALSVAQQLYEQCGTRTPHSNSN